MKIDYTKIGDYYIPNLEMNFKGFKTYSELGKYARMRLNYLKGNKNVTYQIMLMNGTLYLHLQDVQDIAKAIENKIIEQFAKQEDINEKLKETNPLKWVQCMNNIKNRVEEIVLKEVVYEEV